MSSDFEKNAELMSKAACIILAGGQGTRLFPLTKTRCKPAVSFAGRYRLIDIPISNSLNAGIQDIFVISQYFAASLNQHILETYQLDHFRHLKIHLLCPEETPSRPMWFKGTADAIRQNLEHFQTTKAEYFLILSGDQLYNMDFVDMMEFAKKEQADLVIAALPVKEKEAKRMGLLKLKGDFQVIDFVEKPSEPNILKEFEISHTNKNHYLGSMGIYIFKREVLFNLLKEEGDDFGKNLIPKQLKRGKVVAYLYKNYWEDIGTIDSYFQSNLALTQADNCLDVYNLKNPIFTHPEVLPSPLIKNTLIHQSIISQGAVIEAKEISHSVLGLRVRVGKGTIIRDSVILGNSCVSDPFVIGEECLIEHAIIDEHCSIGNRVQLTNKDKLTTYESNGIFIRDGIIVVTSGTKVPDGFIL